MGMYDVACVSETEQRALRVTEGLMFAKTRFDREATERYRAGIF